MRSGEAKLWLPGALLFRKATPRRCVSRPTSKSCREQFGATRQKVFCLARARARTHDARRNTRRADQVFGDTKSASKIKFKICLCPVRLTTSYTDRTHNGVPKQQLRFRHINTKVHTTQTKDDQRKKLSRTTLLHQAGAKPPIGSSLPIQP